MSEAIGLLLTFTTYGTHLHGAASGSVDRLHRNVGAPSLEADPEVLCRAWHLMNEREFFLREPDRKLVLQSIVSASDHRRWRLYCAHVRGNHVHLVIQTGIAADRAMAYLKARTSFALR